LTSDLARPFLQRELFAKAVTVEWKSKRVRHLQSTARAVLVSKKQC
jgi:hypothetical protein